MKNLLLTLLVVLPLTAFSSVQDEGAQSVILPTGETVQEQAIPVEVQVSDKIAIRLRNGQHIDIDTIPSAEDMKVSLGLKIPEQVRRQIIAAGGTPTEANPFQAYETLNEQDRRRFQDLRLKVLTGTAQILLTTRFALGVGSYVGDGITMVKNSVVRAFGRQADPVQGLQRSFNERSLSVLQKVLRGIDHKMWFQAPLVIGSNEFGLMLSVGIIAEGGFMRRGAGGVEELGFSFGYNKTTRSIVFEIFHNTENFDSSMFPAGVVGAIGKAAPTISRRNGQMMLEGTSFYPPGAPVFSSVSSDFFTAGPSSSLGLPPPPAADLMTYSNTFQRRSLLRLTVSPIVKGFIRVQFGDFVGAGRAVVFRFVDMYNAVQSRVFKRRSQRLSCTAVL